MPDYRAALATRSSYFENVLTHLMIAALAGELWRRDPEVRMDILRTEVDESGSYRNLAAIAEAILDRYRSCLMRSWRVWAVGIS